MYRPSLRRTRPLHAASCNRIPLVQLFPSLGYVPGLLPGRGPKQTCLESHP